MPEDGEKILGRLDDVDAELKTLRYLVEWVLAYTTVGTRLSHASCMVSGMLLPREDRDRAVGGSGVAAVKLSEEAFVDINKTMQRAEARERVDQVRDRLAETLLDLAGKAVIKFKGES